MTEPVFILGGLQTDFARNWAREGLEIADVMRETVLGGLEQSRIDAREIEVAHVGNFVAELFCNQGHLGGVFAAVHPDLAGVPAARHEGACASGSLALMAAMADLESGRYGLRNEHLARIAEINFGNARRNPNAQTRRWTFTERSFAADDEANPVIEGRIRKQDCGQITDGAAVVFLANARRAAEYASARGLSLDDLPRIRGWGHRTAPITYDAKVRASEGQPYIFPEVRRAITDAFRRAGIGGVDALDGIETHDCFTTTEYMAIDHFGITPPGESWRAIEAGDIETGGRIPVNPSGGLIGAGHPVGATGVRMALDCFRQVTGAAGGYQVEGARTFATLNIGGSGTTIVSLVIGR